MPPTASTRPARSRPQPVRRKRLESPKWLRLAWLAIAIFVLWRAIHPAAITVLPSTRPPIVNPSTHGAHH